MNLIELARTMRPLIVQAAASLSDRDISMAPCLCNRLRGDGSAVPAGTRIFWKNAVFRSTVTLWDRPEFWPDKNPNGWEAIPYREGIRIIPRVITVGTAFSPGEQGWWEDCLMQSILPGPNTHNPDEYPDGWEKI